MPASWILPRIRPRIAIGLVAALAATSAIGQALAADGDRYAGIEIGSKGVKTVVIAAGSPGNVMEGIANTTLSQGVAKTGVFSESAIADTAEEAGKFADRIRDEFKVPAGNISIFGSSGLPKATNRDALIQAVADATKLAPMTFIDPADEVKYSIKGLLDSPADRAGALLVDVGSGNTKGGYLHRDGVVDFSIPFGSVTFENRVAEAVAKDKKPFAEDAAGLRSSLLEPELAKQVAAHPALADRGIVFLSGGAAYAMATLLKPLDAAKPRIDLTTKDIASYAAMVRQPKITSPELDAAKGTPAEKDVKNVLDNFTPTNLVAGSEILTALAGTLNLEGKTLRFDRTAVMALARGKVLSQIEANPGEVATRTGAPADPPMPPEEAGPAPDSKELPKPPVIPSKSLPAAASP